MKELEEEKLNNEEINNDVEMVELTEEEENDVEGGAYTVTSKGVTQNSGCVIEDSEELILLIGKDAKTVFKDLKCNNKKNLVSYFEGDCKNYVVELLKMGISSRAVGNTIYFTKNSNGLRKGGCKYTFKYIDSNGNEHTRVVNFCQ